MTGVDLDLGEEEPLSRPGIRKRRAWLWPETRERLPPQAVVESLVFVTNHANAWHPDGVI